MRLFAVRVATLAGGLTLATAGCCRLEVNGQERDTSGGSTGASGTTGGEGGSSSGGGSTGGSTTGVVICYKDQFPVNHRVAPSGCDGGTPGDSNDACFNDADCLKTDGGTRVCSCSPASFEPFPGPSTSANTCVPGNCSVDSDCPCGYCSPTFSERCTNLYGVVGYFCHSGADSCTNDSECDGGYCVFGADAGAWACDYDMCYTAQPGGG